MWLEYLLWTFVGAAVATIYGIVMQRRHVPRLTFEASHPPRIEDGMLAIAGLTRAALHFGNSAQVVQNGSFFDLLERDIRGARHSVHIETFVWSRGELERRFADLLCAKAAEGTKVRVVIDAVGGIRASSRQLRRMRKCGVDVQIFCRPRWWNLRRLNHRTHRKIFIIDGRIGYTGGHGIADQWLGGAQDRDHWRDTAVRLEGPAVHSLQSIFMENFIWESQHVPRGEQSFPALEPRGGVVAQVVSDSCGLSLSSVAMLYAVAITCAREEVLIQNPYFAPDETIVELFVAVIRRGVTVQLMVPGANTDSPVVRRAGFYLYGPLLRAGVRIYEFTPTLLHQKVVIVDSAWSHIGSSNFDSRSLKVNEEVSVGLLDRAIAVQLKRAFADDLRRCEELTLEEWRTRSAGSRLLDWAAYQAHDHL